MLYKHMVTHLSRCIYYIDYISTGHIFCQINKSSKDAKLTDFGLSQSSESESTASGSKVWKDSRYRGTRVYQAPELYLRDSNNPAKPNYQTDVFSLGATLTELLSSRRLYGADNSGKCHAEDHITRAGKESDDKPFAAQHLPTEYRKPLWDTLKKQPNLRPPVEELALKLRLLVKTDA